MATAAELAALAAVIDVQAPAALAEALREIERLRDENQRITREYLALKVCALRGEVYVNRNLDANLRYPITWAEAAEDLGAEAEMAWDYADRLKKEVERAREYADQVMTELMMEIDELKEGGDSGSGTRPQTPQKRREKASS
ncbi:MAG: hypothetical protein B7Z74_10755 [Deltaproteobacteria bacterium 21-66-5]|nr:MAG: hypothetical protein B7Z74_10755 [Deltaproteobacteria bacterium 21-66-5]